MSSSTSKSVRGKSDGVAAYMRARGERARSAARAMARAESGIKNAALFALAKLLLDETRAILEANAIDMREWPPWPMGYDRSRTCRIRSAKSAT